MVTGGIMLKRKRQNFQINNKGVTLVELIIAVAILGIVVTPLLHAFITSTKINASARDTLEETTLAENIMEEFNDASIEDMVTKYAGMVEDTTGIVSFVNVSHLALTSDIDSDVRVDITLDPVATVEFQDKNNMNLVDLKTISSINSAIYSMPQDYDGNIYDIFVNNSNSANSQDPETYPQAQDRDFFEDNLNRTIFVTITKTGETTEGVPLVRVEMNIVYEYRGSVSCLESSDRRYTTDTKELFDNTQSEIELNALYLMYVPRYDAVLSGHYDDIRILNYSNVPNTNVPYDVSTVAATELRTNMHSDLPNEEGDPNAELNCTVQYRNQTGSYSAAAQYIESILNIRALDGRTFDNSSTGNRIYEMMIEIYKIEMIEGTPVRETLLTMSGTKIE